MRHRTIATLLTVAAVLAASCEGRAGDPPPSAAPSVVPPRDTIEEPPGRGIPPIEQQRLVSGEAARIMAQLCVPPELDVTGGPPKPRPVDPQIAEVEDQVSEVRRLEWLRPVVAEPIDDEEMDRRIDEAFEAQFPEELYDRRTLAWRAIGAIGPQDDLHDALLAFGRGQVVGYYDPQSGELVYLADARGGDLGLTEKAVLAHELTHALDDQHFDLRRVDALVVECRDEELAAALGAVEGSAQYFATQVLVRFPAPVDAGALEALGQGVAEEVPPFVAQLQLLSYTEGQEFVTAIASDGVRAVDRALEDLPPTTEQVLHPERWPDDDPTPVEPVDLTDGFTPADAWRDLDVMQVGELWLRELLQLRLDEGVGDEAAAGWDGGAYRAWVRHDDAVAVALRTAWDTRADAEEFADAMEEWFRAGARTGEVVGTSGTTVDVAFASGGVSLRELLAGAPAAR